MAPSILLLLLVCLGMLASTVVCLNNGMGLTPPMGYSSWNDCASEVTEERIKNVTLALISTGLAAKGYVHVNVDEGWLKGRDPATGMMVEDRAKFPSGMKALGEWIHQQEVPGMGKVMKYGLYTSRGTCQCTTKKYPHAPGSHGFEKKDAQWMVDVGMDYLKEDSCCGSNDHATAFNDYATMRDALNATGRPVYFSLCGWNTFYAPVGDSLGNSWRIAGDGTNWGALSACINKNVPLAKYARPGAWNDPDLLQGTGQGSNDKDTNPSGCFKKEEIPQSIYWYQTERQARTQFSMWSVMSSPLLISADVGQVSSYLLDTWGNEEVIAVSQSFRQGGPYQGSRLAGEDLVFDSISGNNTGKGTNVWGKLLPGHDFALVFVNNNNVEMDITCDNGCLSQMTTAFSTSWTVRDLWAHQNLTKPLTMTGDSKNGPGRWSFTAPRVTPSGGVAMFRFSPTGTGTSLS